MSPEAKALEAASAVEVLRLHENDVVLVTISDLYEFTVDQVERMKALLREKLDGTGVKNVGLVVKGSGVRLQVLRPDAAYEKHADDCLQGCDQFPAPGCTEGNELYDRTKA
jgi:hypothetical protein